MQRTNSFRRLSNDLNEAYGIHSYVNKTSKKNEERKDQWKIRFASQGDVKKFFNYPSNKIIKQLTL